MTDLENERAKENWLASFMRRVWWTYLVAGGMLIGFAFGTINMQSEAINQGLAHYHSQTGKWQWGVSSEIMISDKLPEDIFTTPKKAVKK